MWAVIVLVTFLYLLYRLGLQCQHEEQFEHAVDVLIKRLEIDPRHKSHLSSLLMQHYNDDIHLWVEKNPMRRITRFFQGIKSQVRHLSATQSCKPKDFVIKHFNLMDARNTTVLEKNESDLHIQRLLRQGTWGSNLTCVLAVTSRNESDKEYKIINTWRALPEIDYFIIQKMRDKLDSSAKSFF